MCVVLTEMFSPLQLQSNLIPGLNLNALGLFPSGAGMGPSMSSVPPPGAHGACSSFGVSDSLLVTYSTVVFSLSYHFELRTGSVFHIKLDILQLLDQASDSYNFFKLADIWSLATQFHVSFFL